MQKAIGDDVEDLAGLCAQHASEVLRLLSGERGVGWVAGGRRPGVGDEAAAGHALGYFGMGTVSGPWWYVSMVIVAEER
jgi:hypothetical protein